MTKQIDSMADLMPDARNANKGTQRGRGALDHSLRNLGAGRSILVDRDGEVIAGNKTLEAAADIGLDVQVVQTDGNRLVVVQRTDLDLDSDKRARELAYADNRVAQIDLDWDTTALAADLDAGLDLSAYFRDDELSELLNTPPDIAFREYDETIADGLVVKAKWSLVFPQEATAIVQETLIKLQQRLPELQWQESTTV